MHNCARWHYSKADTLLTHSRFCWRHKPIRSIWGKGVWLGKPIMTCITGWATAQKLGQSQASAWFERAAQGDQGISERRYYNDQPVDYLFYQGMALRALDRPSAADALFISMLDWAQQQSDEAVSADFFAVSLPDLLVLNSNRQTQHREHVLLVKGLAELGMGDRQAIHTLKQVLVLNPANNKAQLFLHLAE